MEDVEEVVEVVGVVRRFYEPATNECRSAYTTRCRVALPLVARAGLGNEHHMCQYAPTLRLALCHAANARRPAGT